MQISKNKYSIDLIKQAAEWAEQSSLKEAAKKFNIPYGTLKGASVRLGFRQPIRIHSKCTSKHKQPLQYFHDIDSHEKAYYLGLIYADGSISKGSYPNSKVFSIGLQLQDKYILERLLVNMNANTQIYEYKNSARINLYDPAVFDDLQKHGVMPSKSYLEYNIPNINQEYINSFLLGYFDGDGCITVKPNGTSAGVNITSNSERFLKDVHKHLNVLGIKTYIRKIKKPTGHLFVLYVSGKANHIKFRDYLYKDFNHSLLRKKNKFYQIN